MIIIIAIIVMIIIIAIIVMIIIIAELLLHNHISVYAGAIAN